MATDRPEGPQNAKGASPDDPIVVEIVSTQLQHFSQVDPPCRGMQLPEGLMLRYAEHESLFFFLKTWVETGKIKTRIFASDNPYERMKAHIGEVITPMFEAKADAVHLQKTEDLLRTWVDFICRDPSGPEFRSFEVRGNPKAH